MGHIVVEVEHSGSFEPIGWAQGQMGSRKGPREGAAQPKGSTFHKSAKQTPMEPRCGARLLAVTLGRCPGMKKLSIVHETNQDDAGGRKRSVLSWL